MGNCRVLFTWYFLHSYLPTVLTESSISHAKGQAERETSILIFLNHVVSIFSIYFDKMS